MNLDGIDKDELWHLHNLLRQHPLAEARRWFPDRPRGYVAATCTLEQYAANKATAMKLRAEGNVATAMVYEAICDRLYRQLPEFAKW